MTSSKPKLTNLICLRLNEDTLTAIRKSGQNTSDWFRQAARNRIDGARQAETPTGKLEKQIAALQQHIDDLKKDGIDTRKEVTKLQQSDSIVQATLLEMRRSLTTIQQNQAAAQQNHVELRRSLEQINAGFGHAFTALGQSLLVALGQQLRELVKAHEQPPKRPLPPPLPRTQL